MKGLRCRDSGFRRSRFVDLGLEIRLHGRSKGSEFWVSRIWGSGV